MYNQYLGKFTDTISIFTDLFNQFKNILYLLGIKDSLGSQEQTTLLRIINNCGIRIFNTSTYALADH